ncbi:MAG: hypothetical protein J6U53_06405 [Tidjanibacter sp.]|nr:hypothetical protein [Tidjanibacter sp.]
MKRLNYEAPQLSTASIEVESGIAMSTPEMIPVLFFEIEDANAEDYGPF